MKLKIPIVSHAEAAKADYIICMPVGPSPFDDNEVGVCCKCGRQVMFRPYMPKRPKKICLECMVRQEEGDDDSS